MALFSFTAQGVDSSDTSNPVGATASAHGNIEAPDLEGACRVLEAMADKAGVTFDTAQFKQK